MLPDFPKIQCPFVRKKYSVDIEGWNKYGKSLKLRSPEVYLVTPEITPGFEWVLESQTVWACEKLDGTNVCIHTQGGRLLEIQNRENPIDILKIVKGPQFIIEGVFSAVSKGYVEEDGIQFGEVIGPKLQGNPLGLSHHVWYPFSKAWSSLRYNSFSKYPREFWGWSKWLQGLSSRLASKLNPNLSHPIEAEGLIFVDFSKRDGKDLPLMAKLRRDMYPWFYWDKLQIKDLEQEWYDRSLEMSLK